MRVLLATPLYPPDIGGPATHTRILERAMPEKGIELSVETFGGVRHLPAGVRHVVFCWRLFRAAKGVDAVYALDPFSVGAPALVAAWARRKPFIVRISGEYAWEQSWRFGVDEDIEEFAQGAGSYPLPLRFMKYMQSFVARRARKVIVPSAYFKKIIGYWGVPVERIAVVYNGVESDGLDVGRKNVIRGILQFHGPLILTAGRLVPYKNIKGIIEAFVKVRKYVSDARLMIVGAGPQQRELEAHAESRGLTGDVIFAGPLEHEILLRYIKAADAFVLNAHHEPFANLVLEALAVGTPTVAAHSGGTPEVITHEQTGLLVAARNHEALAAAIVRVLTEPALKRKLASGGKRQAAKFTRRAVVEAVAAILKEYEHADIEH